jgi:hypothetical protein
MKKKYLFKITISATLIFIMFILIYYFVYLPKAQATKQEKILQVRNNELLTQIVEIENKMEGVVSGTKTCVRLLFHQDVEKSTVDCANVNNISDWVRSTPFNPELLPVKNELLVFADLLDEYVYEILIYNNGDGQWRGEMDKNILIQDTKIREAILDVENNYNIKR